jgi:hypothetical protein
MYEQGYLMNLSNACGESFQSFAQAVVAAKDIRMSMLAQEAANKSLKPQILPKSTNVLQRPLDRDVSTPFPKSTAPKLQRGSTHSDLLGAGSTSPRKSSRGKRTSQSHLWH